MVLAKLIFDRRKKEQAVGRGLTDMRIFRGTQH
jgi:hypothetical protein